jgi:hypothetical protein
MARKKHYPVQLRTTLGVALPSNPDTNLLIRTDKLLSNVNHRLYRQSRVYHCKLDIDADTADGGYVDIYAIADTWYNQKAYQFAHKEFMNNSKQELAQIAEGSKARWNDFRVDHGDTIDQELQAIQFTGATGTRFTAGEYELSEVTDSSGTSNTFRWVGSGANTFNIITEYDRTGATSAVPSTAANSAAYGSLEDELDDIQMAHLQGDGNNPPYSNATLETQAWVFIGRLYVDATGTSKLSSGFFKAPSGLIRLSTGGGLNAQTITEKIHLEVKSGDYKGCGAPSYLE